jgi:hypothetical protein
MKNKATPLDAFHRPGDLCDSYPNEWLPFFPLNFSMARQMAMNENFVKELTGKRT